MNGQDPATCPVCGIRSISRHSSYRRTLHDLPAQGTPVTVRARLTRWRCRNDQCERRIFAERLPRLAAPFARRTARLAGIVRLFGHGADGRPAERLMARLGMPVGHTTTLRDVKRSARTHADPALVRVAGIDDRAWRKGMTYGTVIVDLERRRVVDLLPDRSAASTAKWLKGRPEVEVVSRDRAGLYAEGAREGAPQARQVADRFHLLRNFREAIERQLGRFEAPIREAPVLAVKDETGPEQSIAQGPGGRSDVAEHRHFARRARRAARQALFDQIRAHYDTGKTVAAIARELGLGRRRVDRWVRLIVLPERNSMAPKASTPAYHEAFLSRRWAEGTTAVRRLFGDIWQRGYTGSYSHLARFLAPWRNIARPLDGMSGRPSNYDTPGAVANAGSDDWPPDFATDCCRALREAAGADDAQAEIRHRLKPDQQVAVALSDLFGLSASEARVTALLSHGWTIQSSALALDLSPGTVRNHLKSVFWKTGVGRQTDLAVLVSGI
ncbi:Transposase [Rhizobiales bacterium GAS191]|nr:Transposase [Rhizobiales bacterium GAS191]